MNHHPIDTCLPYEAEIIERTEESPTIFTLRLRFLDLNIQQNFLFTPGQFNMVYLFGVGEVAISIVSDPEDRNSFSHTIRAVGHVTKALQKLQVGDRLGIRGPYGKCWPLQQAKGKDVVIITGGLGCAPTLAVIHYIMLHREQYGELKILQGVKHSEDFIFQKHYAAWQEALHTEIYIAADQAGPHWPWSVGYVTDSIEKLNLHPDKTIVMMCGPEGMLHTAINALINKNIKEEAIFLSIERNMECGIGHCGHCQFGGKFICKDGPIFSYNEIKNLFGVPGF